MESDVYTLAIFGLPVIGGLIGAAAKKLVPGVARVAGGVIKKLAPGARKAAQAIRSPAGQTAVQIGGGVAVGRAITPSGGRSIIPPQGAVPGPGGRTTGRIQRFGQAIVPGGRTGRELTPIGTAQDKIGRPMLLEPDEITRTWCPPGYVAVTLPDGSKACALKKPAMSLGLWKPERKPPITAGDWHRLQVAARVKERAKKISQTAGWKVTSRGSGRRRTCQ